MTSPESLAHHGLHIVLTGTIVPNAILTAMADPARRRQEYLDAIRHYSRFGPVHFLENSSYDVEGDPEFRTDQNVIVHKFPPSTFFQRGKGFQEFEMIDAWVNSGKQVPARWLKISGRYLVRNADEMLADCASVGGPPLVIDLCARSRIARTFIFSATTAAYRQRIEGAYLECDDESGAWIERVLFRRLQAITPPASRLFSSEPHVDAVSGSTGGSLRISPLRHRAKALCRTVNRWFDDRQLWYAKW